MYSPLLAQPLNANGKESSMCDMAERDFVRWYPDCLHAEAVQGRLRCVDPTEKHQVRDVSSAMPFHNSLSLFAIYLALQIFLLMRKIGFHPRLSSELRIKVSNLDQQSFAALLGFFQSSVCLLARRSIIVVGKSACPTKSALFHDLLCAHDKVKGGHASSLLSRAF